MKPRLVVSILLAAVVSGGLVFMLSRGPVTGAGAKAEDDPVPVGPQPKAVAEETTFNFGGMEVGEEMTHEFIIKNEGEAPLNLTNGGTSCSCTTNLLEDVTLQPGESAPVTLTWTPRVTDSGFSKSATVNTNDPERRTITLVIEGAVDELLNLSPASLWDVGTVPSGDEVTVKGSAYSRVVDSFTMEFEHDDQFQITEPVPMTEEELSEYEALCGFTYEATVAAGEIDAFTRAFKIKTSVGDGTEHQMKVTGHARGPLMIVPVGDFVYSRRAKMASLGRFDAAVGRSVRLALLIRDLPEDGIDTENITISTDRLTVDIARDKTFRVPNKARFEMTIDFPAGGMPEIRKHPSPAEIVIPTSHPVVKDITVLVEYVAE